MKVKLIEIINCLEALKELAGKDMPRNAAMQVAHLRKRLQPIHDAASEKMRGVMDEFIVVEDGRWATELIDGVESFKMKDGKTVREFLNIQREIESEEHEVGFEQLPSRIPQTVHMTPKQIAALDPFILFEDELAPRKEARR